MPEPITLGSLISGLGKTVLTGLAYGAGSELGKELSRKLINDFSGDASFNENTIDASEFAELCKNMGGTLVHGYLEDGTEFAACIIKKEEI